MSTAVARLSSVAVDRAGLDVDRSDLRSEVISEASDERFQQLPLALAVVASQGRHQRPVGSAEANLTGVLLETLTREVTYGLPQWRLDRCGTYEDLHRFAVAERDLFRNLRPMHGAPASLRRIAHQHQVRIRIITHRLFISHFHQTAISQTVQWLDHHGIPYWDLCFMRDKAAVGADLYIEDSPSNVVALRADNHPTIVFSNSTNRNLDGPRADTWEQVEELVAEQIARWNSQPLTKQTEGV